MNSTKKRVVATETALAGVAGFLAIVTVFWRDWIEFLFRWDPDHHSGTAELLIIGGLAAASVLLGSAAWLQTVRWRRAGVVPG
jgi:hypothetical protein